MFSPALFVFRIFCYYSLRSLGIIVFSGCLLVKLIYRNFQKLFLYNIFKYIKHVSKVKYMQSVFKEILLPTVILPILPHFYQLLIYFFPVFAFANISKYISIFELVSTFFFNQKGDILCIHMFHFLLFHLIYILRITLHQHIQFYLITFTISEYSVACSYHTYASSY